LEAIEHSLNLLISLCQVRPALVQRSSRFSPGKIKAHLDAVERVAASMTEATEHLTDVFESLGVIAATRT
jgi:hypothetical protein